MTTHPTPDRRRRLLRASRNQRGAVLVEAAMVFMILFTIVFGIVEFGLQFKDSLTVTSAVRAGVRSASAATRNSSYNIIAVNSVVAAQSALGGNEPQTLWIYKADPATGYAVGDSPAGSFTSCTYCEQYTWDTGTSTWTCINNTCDTSSGTPPYPAKSWPGMNSASAQYSCITAPGGYTPTAGTITTGTNSGPDSVGVYLKILHKNITGLFGANKVIQDHAVARLEPVALNQTCYG